MLTPAIEKEIRTAIRQHGDCVVSYLEEKFNVLILDMIDLTGGMSVEILDLPEMEG